MTHNNWIQTYAGQKFNLLEIDLNTIMLEDIAHALSNVCRFAGHTKQFYSVAQHSILVSRIVPNNLKLTALLHDAPEAYIADISRPLKRLLGESYAKIEDRIWSAIIKKYALDITDYASVKWADNVLLATEKRDLMVDLDWGILTEDNPDFVPLPEHIIPMEPAMAEALFLQTFFEYTAA